MDGLFLFFISLREITSLSILRSSSMVTGWVWESLLGRITGDDLCTPSFFSWHYFQHMESSLLNIIWLMFASSVRCVQKWLKHSEIISPHLFVRISASCSRFSRGYIDNLHIHLQAFLFSASLNYMCSWRKLVWKILMAYLFFPVNKRRESLDFL